MPSRDPHQRRANENTLYNGCEFACQLCNRTEVSVVEMQDHHQSRHCKNGVPLSTARLEAMAVQTSNHRCRVCGVMVLRDLTFIERHVTSVHGMDMDRYKDMKRLPVVTAMANAARAASPEKPIAGGGRLSPYYWWINGCTYRCAFCRQTFRTAEVLTLHLGHVHKVVNFRNPMSVHIVEMTMFKCAVCGITCPRNVEAVTIHMLEEAGHPDGVEQYYIAHVANRII